MGKVVVRGEHARDRAIDIVKNGGTFEDAAKETGYCSNYVRQLCKKAGVSAPKNTNRKEKAIELIKQGVVLDDIVVACGYANQKSIYDLANKYGLTLVTKNGQKKELREKIIAYRKEGHYIRECCEKFGVKREFVNSACSGIEYDWVRDTQTMSEAAKKQHAEKAGSHETIIKLLSERNPGFEYVGGYTNAEGSADIRCKKCGAVFSRSYCSIKQGRVKCTNCSELEKEKKRKEIEYEREQRKLERDANIKLEQLEFKVCPECSSLFVDKKRKYCSDECSKKALNRKVDKRIKKIKKIVVHKNISLQRLFERDNGICYLCGEACDWNDFKRDENNYFIAGGSYPSIDHVVPISKGGLHSWDNVKLAHFYCNTLKSNKVV